MLILWDDVVLLALAMETEQVNTLSEGLGKSVTVMMELNSTQYSHQEALKLCEEFRERCLSVFCVA